MSLIVENDILKRFCDKCGKEWGVDFGVVQRASLLGEAMVEKIKLCKFYCNKRCSEPDAQQIYQAS